MKNNTDFFELCVIAIMAAILVLVINQILK